MPESKLREKLVDNLQETQMHVSQLKNRVRNLENLTPESQPTQDAKKAALVAIGNQITSLEGMIANIEHAIRDEDEMLDVERMSGMSREELLKSDTQ